MLEASICRFPSALVSETVAASIALFSCSESWEAQSFGFYLTSTLIFFPSVLATFSISRKFNILPVVLNTGYCTFRCSDTVCQFLLSQSTFPPCFSQNNTDLELLISGVGACLLPLSGALFAPREHGLDSPYRRSRGQLEPPHLAHDRQYSDRGDDRADRSREEGRYSPVG